MPLYLLASFKCAASMIQKAWDSMRSRSSAAGLHESHCMPDHFTFSCSCSFTVRCSAKASGFALLVWSLSTSSSRLLCRPWKGGSGV